MWTKLLRTACAAHIQDCECWWLSSCRGSVAEYWWLKPNVVWLPVTTSLFTFLYFHLITSKFLSMRHDALSSQHFRSLVNLWKAKETNCQLSTGIYLPSGICHTAQQAVASYWGTSSCTTYPLQKTSVTLIPQEEIKEQIINIHVMLTAFSLMRLGVTRST